MSPVVLIHLIVFYPIIFLTMKKILLLVTSLFLFSACGENVYDKTISVFDDATEQIVAVKDKEELRQVNRKLNAEYSALLREHSEEFAELRQKALDGDKKVERQFEKVKEAKRLYRKAKKNKLDELRD